MKTIEQKLLLISRDTLLEALNGSNGDPKSPASEQLFRALAGLSRHGYHLLLTAPEPDRWSPTRGNVDDALNSQSTLMENARAAGGEFDGIYYVPRSLLTQDRNREGALRDILKRYSLEPQAATLMSSSKPFVKAADRVGIKTVEIALRGKQGNTLLSALKSMN